MKPNFLFHLYNNPTVAGRVAVLTFTQALIAIARLNDVALADTVTVFDRGARVFFVFVQPDIDADGATAEPVAEISIGFPVRC